MNSLVSIIITTHNRSDLVCKAVTSALNQTYPNLEVIVIDNDSTDDTKERLSSFDDRVRYFCKKNEGACSARNFGIRQAKGEYIALLDSDDLYLSKKIELSVDHLNKYPDVGFVHTAAYFVDENDCEIRKYSHGLSRHVGWITRHLITKNYICNSTIVLKKSCLEKSGLFDETIFCPADWDMWLRLSEHYKVGYIAVPLTKYRVSGNYILDNLEESKVEEEVVLNKYFDRNPAESRRLRKKVFSALYLRYAQAHCVKAELSASKEFFIKSLKVNPLNFKAFLMFLYFIFARENLYKRLKMRILRV